MKHEKIKKLRTQVEYDNERGCNHKIAHSSLKEAIDVSDKIFKLKGDVLTSYLCANCGLYHNGRNSNKEDLKVWQNYINSPKIKTDDEIWKEYTESWK